MRARARRRADGRLAEPVAPLRRRATAAAGRSRRTRAHVAGGCTRLGYEVGPSEWARFARAPVGVPHEPLRGAQPRWLGSSHRLATAYLHGRPGTAGYARVRSRVRGAPAPPGPVRARAGDARARCASSSLAAGVEPSAVHTIPIGIDIEHFPLVDAASGAPPHARALGLPAAAFVVGSFQKDGVGWGEGLEPKLVKGPDVLVAALERMRADVPELHVLLTGPARGYVRRELDRLGVPVPPRARRESRDELARAYHALDVYVVAARQEGGPKAVLESMAAGIPLVTTRVGQAQELVRARRERLARGRRGRGGARAGWTVGVRDGAGRACRRSRPRDGRGARARAARRRGRALLDGFVERRPR